MKPFLKSICNLVVEYYVQHVHMTRVTECATHTATTTMNPFNSAYSPSPPGRDPHAGVEPRRLQKGLMTFTIEAIIEDPIGAVELMRRVSLDQNWQFFVRPAVFRLVMYTLKNDMAQWQYACMSYIIRCILIALARNTELVQLLDNAAMSLIKAPTDTQEAAQARFAWSFEQKLHSMGSLYAESGGDQPPLDADKMYVDEATAQELYDLQMHHVAFRNQFDRFVLVTGVRSMVSNCKFRPRPPASQYLG